MWLLESIDEAEIDEMSNRLTLAGQDGEAFRREASKDKFTAVEDYSVSASTDLLSITEELRGGYGTRNR